MQFWFQLLRSYLVYKQLLVGRGTTAFCWIFRACAIISNLHLSGLFLIDFRIIVTLSASEIRSLKSNTVPAGIIAHFLVSSASIPSWFQGSAVGGLHC